MGKPAYIFVDMAYFPYLALSENAYFGAHTIAVFGIDEMDDTVYVADRGKKPVTVTIEELERARNSKFLPYPPKNKILKIQYPIRTTTFERGIVEGALARTKKIGTELNDIMNWASKELSRRDKEVMELLKGLQDGILECSKKEQEPFKALQNTIH